MRIFFLLCPMSKSTSSLMCKELFYIAFGKREYPLKVRGFKKYELFNESGVHLVATK